MRSRAVGLGSWGATGLWVSGLGPCHLHGHTASQRIMPGVHYNCNWVWGFMFRLRRSRLKFRVKSEGSHCIIPLNPCSRSDPFRRACQRRKNHQLPALPQAGSPCNPAGGLKHFGLEHLGGPFWKFLQWPANEKSKRNSMFKLHEAQALSGGGGRVQGCPEVEERP